MSNVIVDITMSLDGFVTGPNPRPDNGLGDGGEALHKWVFDGNTEEDRRILAESVSRTGAVLMGRRTFDIVDAPGVWTEEAGFGGPRDGRELPKNVVLTHNEPSEVRLVDAFEFVTEGVEAAVARAREIAGDKDVTVMGGGNVCSEVLAAGFADELVIHLAPIVLGSGTPLFSEPLTANLEQRDVVVTPLATHLHYRVC